MSIKKFKLKKFVSTNGTLIPIYLDKIKNFTLKDFLYFMVKKIVLEVIMLIKNVHKFSFLLVEELN